MRRVASVQMATTRHPDEGGVRPLTGRFAWAYDLVVPRPAGGSVDHVARLLGSLGVGSDALVVDAGCGTGRYSEGLAARGFRVIGIDRSEPLIEQARLRTSSTAFLCADLLAWQPPAKADAVLCRGVLNDLTADSERRAAFAAFSSWLVPGGVLLADVRDWDATAARYADAPPHQRSVSRDGRPLRFTSETTLEEDRHMMVVHERYGGFVDGVEVDERYDFVMRCWTAEELRDCSAAAGFAKIEVRPGAQAGIASDRLLLTAGTPVTVNAAG
jgi:SAM-dependent methyltransferase